MEKRRILGLDCSSSTIGLSIIDFDGYKESLIHAEYYKPKKEKDQNFIITLKETREFIIEFCKKWGPIDYVAIEEFLMVFGNKYQKGSSSAQTIIKLAIINRTVSLAVFDALNILPIFLHSSSVRKEIKNAANETDTPKKEDLPALIEKILDIKFPYQYNKRGNLMEESYDIGDAVSTGIALIRKDFKQPIKIKKKRKNKNAPNNTSSLSNTGNIIRGKRGRTKKTV